MYHVFKSFLFVCLLIVTNLASASVIDYFNQIKTDPNALYAFFKKMPKGGELHYHLSGGVYPETMLLLAAKDDYCINLTSFEVQKNAGTCDGITAKALLEDPVLYEKLIKSWSLKSFIPNTGNKKDHFFASFAKYNTIVSDYKALIIADVINRAAQQQEYYLELLDVPDHANSKNFGSLLHENESYENKVKILLNNKDFQKNIQQTLSNTDTSLKEAYDSLGCSTQSNNKNCKVKAKLIYFVLRAQPFNDFFAQALNAFEAVNRSKGNLVGVNLVQEEDNLISIRDYKKQMQVFNFLHQLYPKVHITLHAGELSQESVTPDNLSFHIHDAVFIGQAQRIGHGVDIGYEDNAEELLNYMAKNNILVEINLISNAKLLHVSGKQHPLNYYLQHHVPVALSSDDEGVLRTDLTSQYVEAVVHQGLDYNRLKQINRNTLTYAFLPGKSIWKNTKQEKLVSECLDLNSSQCKSYIKDSEKAKLQWELEQDLIAFEKLYQ